MRATTRDQRFPMPDGSGSDAVHRNPEYAYAVTRLVSGDLAGEGASFTLGDGNNIVCELAQLLADYLIERGGSDIESIMARFGELQKELADHPRLRWLGPHKGAIHLALASVTNAAFDLWAHSREMPLWELLLSLDDEAVVALLDLSWLDDALTPEEAKDLVRSARATRADRTSVLSSGYPGYDTSVGWFSYSDDTIAVRAAEATRAGFGALKLKVGSSDLGRDLTRFQILRDHVDPSVSIMVDANQQWSVAQARAACKAFSAAGAYWIEEPTHPDDILAHKELADIARQGGSRIALGEHVSNRVLFKNFIAAGAVDIVQVDALRVGGVSEFLAVSMLAKKRGLPVIPHVGDMGQLHQHLVLFNHVALNLPLEMLEYIPHLNDRFVHPAVVENGVYITPTAPGAGQELKPA